MKKLFLLFFVNLTFTTIASAQISDQAKRFIINTFPSYMPEYVLQNAEIISVDEHYAKKHKKELYNYTDLKVPTYQGPLRIGDSVLVFNGQAFFSKGQNLFMSPKEKEKKQPKERTVVTNNGNNTIGAGNRILGF